MSRAPLDKLEKYRAGRGWTVPRYSSYGSDFNYDFQATVDRISVSCTGFTDSAATDLALCWLPEDIVGAFA